MSRTVLLVDDSRFSRLMTRAVVEKVYPQWTILEAASGAEALIVADGKAIDFMLIDVNMPGMDGIELSEKMIVRHPESRISLLTANIQDSVQQKAEQLRIGFIAKPVKEDRILAFLTEQAL